MIPIYAREQLPTKMIRSIFLAGPTPRDPEIPSWRPEALQILEELGYDGHVFIPEPQDGQWAKNYDNQVEWEEEALNQADCILFWVPRDLDTMPAFTTNDEWGYWKETGKVVFGAPENAERVRYQQHYAEKYRVPSAATLRDTLKNAVKMVENGRLRQNGEVKVPLYVWNQPSFQSWLSYQNHAGNVLKDARVLWTFRVGKNLDKMFCWVLHVKVYITSEDRVKENEFVFGRPDISSIVLWHRAPTLEDTRVVLVREFRSPARTHDGFLREPPGGSAKLGFPITDPQHTALEELKEETEFVIDRKRLRAQPMRQLFGTLSSVGAFVYSAEITAEELAFFQAQEGKAHGVVADSEQTYTEIYTVGELLKNPLTDWASLGMIFSALTGSIH
jgi:nucleoside 2-deoxyribosyltransferase/8-oxo-dGTP pyrophosphatase MutT (NUDIX family)